MSASDFDRIAQSWLGDGPTTISDRALRAALDEVHLTSQRRPPWSAWRFRPVRFNVAAIAAAAALVVVGLVVLNLNPTPSPGGPSPARSPSPSSTATAPGASAAPTPAESALEDREVTITYGPQYSYELRLALPGSWTGADGDFVVQKVYAGDPPRNVAIATWVVGNVYGEGCQWDGALLEPAIGPGVSDLATALAGLDDRTTTAPVPVTIDGFEGLELEMTIPDIDFNTCDQSEFRSWVSPAGEARFHQGPLEHSRIVILDVGGTRVLVFARSFPASSPADVAEMNAIVDSMQIEVVRASAFDVAGKAAWQPMQ